jgi:hypothetical protein
MAVTSDTLFHFTKSRTNLERILVERFKITYCKENFQLLGKPSGEYYYPMISFCDLPLGSIKNHIAKYGCYGIGMTKEWGIKNKLNPVLYLENSSNIAKDVNEHYDSLNSMIETFAELVDISPDEQNQLIKL